MKDDQGFNSPSYIMRIYSCIEKLMWRFDLHTCLGRNKLRKFMRDWGIHVPFVIHMRRYSTTETA